MKLKQALRRPLKYTFIVSGIVHEHVCGDSGAIVFDVVTRVMAATGNTDMEHDWELRHTDGQLVDQRLPAFIELAQGETLFLTPRPGVGA